MNVRALFLMLVLVIVQTAEAQPRAKRKAAEVPKPTVADFVYGDESKRQVLDFWQADSEEPTPLVFMIHGGGWMGGDKSLFRPEVEKYLKNGISVASINYRLIGEAMKQNVEPPVKASLHDAARALQTVRSKAKEWNLDPTRVALTGSSAGACTSLWLAFHDDLAKPDSADPIERQSTRVTCAAVIRAQTSLDPIEVREWIPNAEYGGHAFGFAAEKRNRPEEFELLIANREKVLPWIKEYSPIELVGKDEPPIYLDYSGAKNAPKVGQAGPDPTHSAMYGVKLAEKLEEAGVEVVLTYPGHPDTKYGSASKFMIEKLKAK